MKKHPAGDSIPSKIIHWFIGIVVRLLCNFRTARGAQIPSTGPAILVANHPSLLDPLFLAATLPRPVLILMERRDMDRTLLKPLLILAGVVPVDFGNAAELSAALTRACQALGRGRLVGVFPEGAVNDGGFLRGFRDHFSYLISRHPCPIVPAYIDKRGGTTGRGKCSVSPSCGIRPQVTVVCGMPWNSTINPAGLRHLVQELSTEAYEMRKSGDRSLGRRMILQARRSWFREAMRDTTGKRLSFGMTLIASLALARAVRRAFRGGRRPRVGVMLPASVGGSLTNVGLTLAGKVPVNLNFTASSDALAQAVDQCGIRTIITCRTFVAKMHHLVIPAGIVFLEDLVKSITIADRIVAALQAIFVPASLLAPRTEGCATVVFSSGSTSRPKGIMLSHHNIVSNIEQMHASIGFTTQDCMCAALPFFHSFGLTVTLWFPLIAGFRVAYHPNPLDGSTIAGLVRDTKATILLATPTFLQTYLRKADADDFASLRLVICGAEKLRPALARAFEEKFGVAPLEGYGATELSPVAALNVPDRLVRGVWERESRPGTIGRLLPGMCARVVDPVTGESMPQGRAGLILLRGPNVMMGYLDQPDETRTAIRNGWYVTGDIASISNDGFVTLTDRLSRFSKIAGEMVPHGAAETILLEALRADEPVVAVTAVSDANRGERLVVMYTRDAGSVERLQSIIGRASIPNLWKPDPDAYFEVDAIPVLGTGKSDFQGIKALARGAVERCGTAMAA